MAAQNIYDDPDFLAGYVTLDRQVHGLDGAAEWPHLRSMLPDVSGRRVVDLGCGFGWFSRWAEEQGAARVLGIDVSTTMLDRARADTAASTVTYRCADLDTLELDDLDFDAPDHRAGTVDLVFSSLALHYVLDLDQLLATVAAALAPGGSLVFSVEHPIYSAPTSQTFETRDNGDQIWPLDNYLVEGERVRTWFVDGVVKHHRTVATHVNALVGAGLVLNQLVEWGPTAQAVEIHPELADDRHRPWFLLIRATRPVR